MNETAFKLPEYPIVMAMKGVGRLHLFLSWWLKSVMFLALPHKGALTAFAGVDLALTNPEPMNKKARSYFKTWFFPDLRKTLFQVMDALIKTKPQDDPVYQFLDKKRAQGKPYYVYMTAGANKFLRIYYGRVKEYLSSLSES